MYIATVPNRRSPPAILLRESYRADGKVKTRTIANLTHWSPARIEGLRKALKGEFDGLSGDPMLCVEHEYAAASPKRALKRLMAWRFACDRRRIISRDSRANSALNPWVENGAPYRLGCRPCPDCDASSRRPLPRSDEWWRPARARATLGSTEDPHPTAAGSSRKSA